GRRWTGAIIRAMLAGAVRFTDIAATVPGLSDRLLSERLKELEQEGVVERTVYPETPVRIEYRLTEKGNQLAPVVEALSAWAERWVPAVDPGEAPPDEPLASSTDAGGTTPTAVPART